MSNRKNFSTVIAAALLVAPIVGAQERPCNLDFVAGEWMFATDVGRQALVPSEGDITAIGVFDVAADGTLKGVFDVTFEDFMHVPDVPYDGTIAVGSDCRGTVTFVTGTGSMRTDSIVVVNANEMIGMSQDINNLWNYTMRRIDRGPGPAALEAKLDAVLKRLGLVPGAFEAE